MVFKTLTGLDGINSFMNMYINQTSILMKNKDQFMLHNWSYESSQIQNPFMKLQRIFHDMYDIKLILKDVIYLKLHNFA